MTGWVKVVLAGFGALFLYQIFMVTFGPTPVKVVYVAKDNGVGYDAIEEPRHIHSRDLQRKAVLKRFETPESLRCDNKEREWFKNNVTSYYAARYEDMERYERNYGKSGAGYIASQYQSSDDRRIERLTGEFYRAGYLRLDDFSKIPRRIIDKVVAGETVSGKGCAA